MRLPLGREIPRTRTHGRRIAGVLVGGSVPYGEACTVVLAAVVSGVVVCTPMNPPTAAADPQTLGELAVTVLSTGGAAWRRVIDLPRWGACVPIPAGTGEVSLLLPQGQRADVSFQPARAGSAWQRVDGDLGAGGSFTVEPPPYAVRCIVAVIEGSAQIFSAIAPALVAPATLDLPAYAGTITAGGAGARVAIAWECTA